VPLGPVLDAVLNAIGSANVTGVTFSQPSATTYVATFDYTGPTETFSVPQAPIAGAAITIADLGPVATYHMRGA
jgi:hypothetical protein